MNTLEEKLQNQLETALDLFAVIAVIRAFNECDMKKRLTIIARKTLISYAADICIKPSAEKIYLQFRVCEAIRRDTVVKPNILGEPLAEGCLANENLRKENLIGLQVQFDVKDSWYNPFELATRNLLKQ